MAFQLEINGGGRSLDYRYELRHCLVLSVDHGFVNGGFIQLNIGQDF